MHPPLIDPRPSSDPTSRSRPGPSVAPDVVSPPVVPGTPVVPFAPTPEDVSGPVDEDGAPVPTEDTPPPVLPPVPAVTFAASSGPHPAIHSSSTPTQASLQLDLIASHVSTGAERDSERSTTHTPPTLAPPSRDGKVPEPVMGLHKWALTRLSE